MSFINLKKSFFVKNKLRINDKVFYKKSDSSTWVYDNILDCKNIVEVINEDLLTRNDFVDNDDPDSTFDSARYFFSILKKKDDTGLTLNDIFVKNDGIKNSKNIDNQNIKSYRFKNKFGIKRHTFNFLAEDNFNYKKNSIKNGLYKNYNRLGQDLHKNLEFGFCNYNTLNFFSFNENIRHGNLIAYANPFLEASSKNFYDLSNNNFTINCRVIFRKINNLDVPNCLIHIPGLINVYFSKTKNNKIRIAATSKENTFKNIYEISESINSILKSNINQNGVDEENVVIQDSNDARIELNNWYSITVKSDAETGVTFYIDDVEVLSTNTFKIVNQTVDNDSYFLLGNTVNYNHEENKNLLLKKYFDLFFYDSNIDIEDSPVKNKDIFIPVEFSNDNQPSNFNYDIHYDENKLESFHGEISDFRIYNRTLRNEEIDLLVKSYITDLNIAINDGLIFYVPVLYVPAEVKGKQIILASGKSDYLKYQGYYNHTFANTCGGLELNISNFLIDFIKGSKPNIVINMFEKENVINNIKDVSFGFSESDFVEIKQGNTLSEIYFKNITNSNDYARSSEGNLIYNNLFILPNDNGIPDINFNIVEQFINTTNFVTNNHYFKSFNNHDKYYFNITCENIVNKNEFISDRINYERLSSLPRSNQYNSITIQKDNINRAYRNPSLPIFDFSNIIFHDESITDYNVYNTFIGAGGKLKDLYSTIKSQYSLTESNPSLRNLFSNNIELRDNILVDGVLYKHSPLPYSDFNKNYDSLFINIFDISTQMYNKKIKKTKFNLSDDDFISGKMTLKDDGYYNLYRSDCNTKVADWNYVGHIFYNDGFVCINNPSLYYFGAKDFNSEFESESFVNIKEINIPADAGLHNQSQNATYDETLRINEAAFNSEENFVYITDINLHDENFNIVAKAKLANPVPKKDTDKLIFRLKMDF